ncbi:MAG: hypothetical protein ACI857_000703 [Arenicella sp.]|jgi:uncharacterized protein (TIGR02453 family)
MISSKSLEFLKKLKKNNERDWFNANKSEYLECHENLISFAEELLSEMNKHDDIANPNGKKCLHRIYRDTRFSKDKTPYKINWSGGFKRDTALLRGGYYFHIAPDASFLAGGFWGPSSDDIKRIREEIHLNGNEFKGVFSSKEFKSNFGELLGESLKTAPKGYTTDHPEIELLRKKQFLVRKSFTDKEVLDGSFTKLAADTFKAMRPFFDLMSSTLTTNSNGEVIV